MAPFIPRFVPNEMAPELLESLLVSRRELAADCVERVRESALTGNKHHVLIVGPRGFGKTHLLSVVVQRVAADGELSESLRIARLNEDETTTSYLDFLAGIYRSLAHAYPTEFPEEDVAEVYELDSDAASELLTQSLLRRLASRTLLIAAENLGEVFAGIGDEGQKRLRSLLQEHAQFTIVATARSLSPAISHREAPFFGFFQVEHLKGIAPGEAESLIGRVAALHGHDGVAEALSTPLGRARIHALEHLCGGSPRVYVTFAQLAGAQPVEEFTPAMLRVLDAMLPGVRSRLRRLSPQQRRIVERLAALPTTVAVRELARSLFMSQQTASSHLKDLKEKGLVTSVSRGRESLYELADPLLRLSLMLRNGQRDAAHSLIELLSAWYEPESEANLGALSTPTALATLFSTPPNPPGEEQLRSTIDVCREGSALPRLGAELVRSVAEFNPARAVPDGVGEWLELWRNEYGGLTELRVPLSIFEVGVRARLDEDPKRLLDLLWFERSLLEESAK